MRSAIELQLSDCIDDIGMQARALQAILFLMRTEDSDFARMADNLQQALQYHAQAFAGQIADLAEGAQR